MTHLQPLNTRSNYRKVQAWPPSPEESPTVSAEIQSEVRRAQDGLVEAIKSDNNPNGNDLDPRPGMVLTTARVDESSCLGLRGNTSSGLKLSSIIAFDTKTKNPKSWAWELSNGSASGIYHFNPDGTLLDALEMRTTADGRKEELGLAYNPTLGTMTYLEKTTRPKHGEGPEATSEAEPPA